MEFAVVIEDAGMRPAHRHSPPDNMLVDANDEEDDNASLNTASTTLGASAHLSLMEVIVEIEPFDWDQSISHFVPSTNRARRTRARKVLKEPSTPEDSPVVIVEDLENVPAGSTPKPATTAKRGRKQTTASSSTQSRIKDILKVRKNASLSVLSNRGRNRTVGGRGGRGVTALRSSKRSNFSNHNNSNIQTNGIRSHLQDDESDADLRQERAQLRNKPSQTRDRGDSESEWLIPPPAQMMFAIMPSQTANGIDLVPLALVVQPSGMKRVCTKEKKICIFFFVSFVDIKAIISKHATKTSQILKFFSSN
jgi:hypothetical protein